MARADVAGAVSAGQINDVTHCCEADTVTTLECLLAMTGMLDLGYGQVGVTPAPWLSRTLCDQAAQRTRLRSRSKPARPYIWRLSIFSRLIWPSACPLLHGSDSAARTAA